MAERLGQTFARNAANFMEDYSFLGRLAFGLVSFFTLDFVTDRFVSEDDGLIDNLNPFNDIDETLADIIKWGGSIFAAWGLFDLVRSGLDSYGGEDPVAEPAPTQRITTGMTP